VNYCPESCILHLVSLPTRTAEDQGLQHLQLGLNTDEDVVVVSASVFVSTGSALLNVVVAAVSDVNGHVLGTAVSGDSEAETDIDARVDSDSVTDMCLEDSICGRGNAFAKKTIDITNTNIW
jgi:hypothetical protein